MVVALEVSHDRVYAAYGDAKIRVWQRTWDDGLKHVRLATIPRTGNYVRSYISGKDKMVNINFNIYFHLCLALLILVMFLFCPRDAY